MMPSRPRVEPTPDLVERLRLLLNDTGPNPQFSDDELEAILRQSDTFDAALALAWQVLAVKLASRMVEASYGTERYRWANPLDLAKWAQAKADEARHSGVSLVFSSGLIGGCNCRSEGDMWPRRGCC